MAAPELTAALRNTLRRPGFACIAIALLALGAGANAAVFAVVRGVVLRPLPFPESQRLVAFWPNQFISNEEIDHWRTHTRSFENIAAQAPGFMMALTSNEGDPLKVTGAKTSDNLFRTLGARPALGRVIEPGDSAPANPRVAVLSDGLWRQRFAADPSAVGLIVELDQEPHTIVGVMPPGFEVLEPGTDVWTALPWAPGTPGFRTTFSQGVARLAPGASAESATSELQALMPAMRTALARDNEWGQTARVIPLQDAITGEVRPTLFILLGAVGLVLLLAAVNLATLVLGRSVERAREMAVRSALGASRGRLVRQLMTEQAFIAAAGTAAGIALAYAVLPVLTSRIPPEVPRVASITLDWTVLVTVLAASIVVALGAALVPAVVACRPSVQPILRQSRSTDSPGRRRALGLLVAGQVALAAVLGIGAGLMLRSLWNLHQVDPGFRADGLLTFRLQTTSKYRTLETGLPYLDQVVERVSALPGVAGVGAVAHPPLSGYAWTIRTRRDDRPLAPGEAGPQVGWRFVGWDYFRTMGIRVTDGRGFGSGDHAQAPAVAVVNATLARQFFGGAEDALGRRLVLYGGGRPGEESVEIVGITSDVRHLALDKAPVPEIFRPMAQTFMFPMAFMVRTSGPPAALAAAVRNAVSAVDPTIPIAELAPYTTLVAGTLGRPRLLGFLLSVFAAAGLLLGIVGLYGVVAYRVRQREREIGIRLALGAEPGRMSRTVLVQGLVYAASGLAIGIPAALWLTRIMESVVFGVTPHDPATFAGLALIVLIVTIAACYLPARRAARIDPATTMRAE
jgi:putative ABC transport system permease protein